ncbi:MAG: TonB C-terminal domain-containing protein [Nitrospinae bacterium]|nr:TonB C-terminal domain-containing protein [Nitrospinota bacterium]
MKRYTYFSILLHGIFLLILLVVPYQKRKIPFDSTYRVSLTPPPPEIVEDKKSETTVVEEKKEEAKKIEEKVVEKKKEAPKKSVAKVIEKKKEEPKKSPAKAVEKKKEEPKKSTEKVAKQEDIMPDIETPESDYTPPPQTPPQASEQKMTVRENMEDFAHPDYLNRVRNTINYHWATASWNIERGRQLLTTVSFRIDRTGVITMIRMEKSSGMVLYDNASIKAVQSSSPLPPLPADYSGNSIDIFFDFAYERK